MDDCWVVTYRPSFFHHIGECDNASRVIKYVGILGYRYNSYNLVDMRIHDINVVADLNVHDPNAPSAPPPAQDPTEPTQSDGTDVGYTPLASAVQFIGTLAQVALTQTVAWWTGYWPVLHILSSRNTDLGGICTLQIGIDILGSTSMEGFSYSTPMDDSMSDGQFNALMESNWGDFYAAAFPIEGVLYAAAEGVAIVMDILLWFVTKIPTPQTLIALTALEALWIGLMVAYLYAVWDGVITGRLSFGEAYGLLVISGLLTLGEDVIPSLAAGKFLRELWYMRGLRNGVGFRVKWCVGLAIFNALVRVAFGAMMLLLALWVFELQVESMNS